MTVSTLSETLDDEQQAFRAELLDAGVLLGTALPGAYIHSEAFERGARTTPSSCGFRR